MLYPILSEYSILTYISPLTYTVSYIFIQYSIFFPNLYPITIIVQLEQVLGLSLAKTLCPFFNKLASQSIVVAPGSFGE